MQAGRRQKRAIENLIETELEINVSSLPEGIDSDEYLIEHGREKFSQYIKNYCKPAVEYPYGRCQ